MGSISTPNIQELISKFNLMNFVESGTYQGSGLRWVFENTKFNQYYSIELNQKYYNAVKPAFTEKNIHIYLGDTIEQLPIILDLIPLNEPILFWLDAHLPEFTDKDFQHAPTMTKIPLKSELEIIKQKRTQNKDVIICDDLRIYEDGPFPHGNWRDRFQFGDLGTKFIYDIFSNTHNILKVYQHEGYIHIFPKENL